MLLQVIRKTLTKLSAGIAFYTCLPIPHTWNLDFNGIARFAPLIGLIVGGILGVIDLGLQILGMPIQIG
ncbi:MAG: adenosylcobinamide-GDP ribazoletransferase, partial [Okeania sp. SIO4D6]|nr:adenosylcobinamide-GDP ribazoletransferase [Okeania sp. SIO4D6]